MRLSCVPAGYKLLMLMAFARLHVASNTCWLWLMVELYALGVLQTWASWVCTLICICIPHCVGLAAMSCSLLLYICATMATHQAICC